MTHNKVLGGHIETNHRVILLKPEGAAKTFVLPKFTASGQGNLKEVIDNDTTTRDKISLNGLGAKKYEY